MTGGASERGRVVVVEDDVELRDVIVECLEQEGYDVLTASNGLEGLLQIKHNRPSVVTLDLRMPRLGGLDALPRIRKFDPAIRVVVVTGDIDDDVHDRALALGASAILTKPVVLNDLVAAVSGATSGVVSRATEAVPRVAPASARSEADAASRPRGRILVVGDAVEIRDVIRDFLVPHGYDVTLAGDAASALHAIRSKAPDVVLLDVDLPDLPGPEFLETIRGGAPRAAVVMVSGAGDVETAKRALARGAFDYVTKPIDLGYLGQTIETALVIRSLDG